MLWTSLFSVMCGCWAVLSSDAQQAFTSVPAGTDYYLRSQGPLRGVITHIEWRYGPDALVEWNADDPSALVIRGILQDRAVLDILTGDLLILGTRANDSGVYTAIINSVQTQKIDINFIYAVPTPTVSWACLPWAEGMILCVLTCEGDTSGAEPVQYSWTQLRHGNLSNDGAALANVHLAKSINLTMDTGSNTDQFVCTIWNAISLQNSLPSTRPSRRDTVQPLKGVIVFVSFIMAITAAITFHRCWTGVWFFHKDSTPWQSDFWKRRSKDGDDSETNQSKELEELKADPDQETAQ